MSYDLVREERGQVKGSSFLDEELLATAAGSCPTGFAGSILLDYRMRTSENRTAGENATVSCFHRICELINPTWKLSTVIPNLSSPRNCCPALRSSWFLNC